MNKDENNIALAVGEITEDFTFSHETSGEKKYKSKIKTMRYSGKEDVIPIIFSEEMVKDREHWKGERVSITGQYRSHNYFEGGKKHLGLEFFARNYCFAEPSLEDKNSIFLDGFIAKQPLLRQTPMGYRICDVLVAVNRNYGKSDYIPCIFWENEAEKVSELIVGTRLKLNGRIQSRNYIKKISEEHLEQRIAYEVSVSKMEVVDSEERKDQIADAE